MFIIKIKLSKLLEIKISMFGMKNKLDRINGRFNIAEENNEDITAGTHVKRHKEKYEVENQWIWKNFIKRDEK